MYLCLTELFEIELFICIKMDLALNNIQRLICHKTQTNKPGEEVPVTVPSVGYIELIDHLFETI